MKTTRLRLNTNSNKNESIPVYRSSGKVKTLSFFIYSLFFMGLLFCQSAVSQTIQDEGPLSPRDRFNEPQPKPEFILKSGNFTDQSAVNIRGITNQFNIFAGEVQANSTNYVTITDYPFRLASTYERTQMLFLASEIGPQAKIFNNLEMQRVNTNTGTVSNFHVRIMHTTLSVLPASYVDMTSASEVYSAASLTIPAGSGSTTDPDWMTISFASNFEYNGTSNLIVEIDWGPRTSGTTSLTVIGKNFGNSNYMAVYGYGTSAGPSYTGRSGQRPNMRFGYQVSAFGTVDAMVGRFVQGCATISNVTYTGENRAIGFFERRTGKTDSDFPFKEGIVLSTGQVPDAAGPNSSISKTTQFGTAGDADITSIGGTTSHDAAVLTFNFVPNASSVTFRYSFGSEEYAEWACSNYNDAFAFYVSGPGITRQNIALIPGTTTPVSIHTVRVGGTNQPGGSTCADQNAAYYVTVPAGSPTIEFDGRTVVLNATISGLQPCSTYLMKLVIADVSDDKWDSGVFLEAPSFGEPSENNCENLNFKGLPTFNVFRNCNPNILRITRATVTSSPADVTFTVGGTAVYGTHHNLAGQTVTIPAGESYVDVPYMIYDNPMSGGSATIVVSILQGCPCVASFVRTIYLFDNYEFTAGSPLATAASSCSTNNGSIKVNLNILASSNLFNFTYVLKDKDGNQLGSYSTGETTYTFTGLAAGTYIIEVYDDVSCTKLSRNNIVVGAPGLPTVACPGDVSVCIDASPITLSGATPGGGTYSGPGVSGGIFTPSVAGIGKHTIIYNYTDPTSLCQNNCFFYITVNALPATLAITGSSICTSSGNNGTITSTTSANGVNYQLYNSVGTPVQGTKAGTGSGLTWSGLSAGTGYYVKGTSSTPPYCVSLQSNAVNVETYTIPVITGATLLADVGTAPSTWNWPVGGSFNSFNIKVDPSLALPSYYFLDINTLISNVALKTGVLNGFVLDQSSLPSNWISYWAAKGVTSSASPGTWQAVMWPIINGNTPYFYIYKTGTDYQLIDGMTWQWTTTMVPWQFTGDYPQWNYKFTGKVESAEGCLSDPFDLNLQIKWYPDVSATITVSPSVMTGITKFNVIVRVTEVNSVNTDGLITVIIPKDSRLTLDGPFDPALYNNSVWTYDSTDPDYHRFTTTSVIAGGTFSTFGFKAQFDPGNTSGVYTITSQIISLGGGEIRVNNNVDSEKIDYFPN